MHLKTQGETGVSQADKKLAQSVHFEPAEPLWKRVPTHDSSGQALSDFMMIIPKLRNKPAHSLQKTINSIEHVLAHYKDKVVFADLNLKLNVLWVSVKPVPGICIELPTAIKLHVPEALLVSHKLQQH